MNFVTSAGANRTLSRVKHAFVVHGVYECLGAVIGGRSSGHGIWLRWDRKGLLTEDTLRKVSALKEIADERGQKLHHLALQWVLRDEVITSALIGASRPEQITDNVSILSMPPLTDEEIRKIDGILA